MTVKTFIAFLMMLVVACPVFAETLVSENARRELFTQSYLMRDKNKIPDQPTEEPVIEKQEKKKTALPGGPKFFVKKIMIDGDTIFPKDKLLEIAQTKGLEGQQVSFEDLEKVTDRITAYYEKNGYTASRAFLPPQKIQDGLVTISIMEVRVGDVQVEGNRWFRSQVYRDALALEPGDFFSVSDLEEAIRQINANPDRFAKAYLELAKVSGSTNIKMKVKDEFPLHASYEYNLRGSRLTQRDRHVIHLANNNLFGFGDSIQSSLSLAEEGALLGGSFHYEFPAQKEGRLYSLDVGIARTRLQENLRPLNVKGKSVTVIPGVIQTFHKSARTKIDGSFRLEIKDSKTEVGDTKLFFDRTRALVAGPQITINDEGGRTFISADLHLGVPDFLGSSSEEDPSASRVGSGGGFVFGSANVARIQRLPFDMTLIAQGSGQYSPEPLTSLEQFYLGGMGSVRGYPENDSSGDSGFSFSQEVRMPLYFMPQPWRNRLSLAAFMDEGRVFNHERQQSESVKNRTLLGAGVGLRFYLSPDTNMQLDLGFPFGDEPTDNHDYQIHLTARGGF